jgi:lipid-A-disaccharide synthase
LGCVSHTFCLSSEKDSCNYKKFRIAWVAQEQTLLRDRSIRASSVWFRPEERKEQPMSTPSILLLAGEASGDYHAAALVRELKRIRPELRVSGIGGDKLADAGMELLHHYRDINTIGLGEGLDKVRHIVAAYRTMKSELLSGRHQIFIPVDYPDVNIRLCRFAKAGGVKVCYYISPQVWAWRKGRIRKIKARVDRMMTIFPFEETLYREHGVSAVFVGHTMAGDMPDGLDRDKLAEELHVDRSKPVIALVPGSRPAEIRRILPVMVEAARIFTQERGDAQFVLPLAGPHLGPLVEEIVSGHAVPVTVLPVEAAKVMAAAHCGLVTSGTATLQAALAEMPHVVVYMVDRVTWWLGLNVLKPLLMDKDIHLAIANVLAIKREKEGLGPIQEMLNAGFRIPCQECGRPLFVPEILQHHVTPENLAGWLIRLSSEPALREATGRGFRQIREMLTPPQETPSAAHVVLDLLDR